MKRGLEVIALVFLLSAVLIVAFLGAPSSPTGMSILNPQAAINTCEWVMNESSTLSGAACNPGDAFGILINASNVVLNCQGNQMQTLFGGIGIIVGNQTNVTIQNCVLTSFDKTFSISNVTDLNISGGTFQGSGALASVVGINISSSSGTHVSGMTLFSTTSLIYMSNVNDSTISGFNGAGGNDDAGLTLIETRNITVLNSNFPAIQALSANCSGCNFTNNTFGATSFSNALNGMRDSYFSQNSFTSSAAHGLQINGPSNNSPSNNTFNNDTFAGASGKNPGYGIYLNQVVNETFLNANIDGTNGDWIYSTNSFNNTFQSTAFFNSWGRLTINPQFQISSAGVVIVDGVNLTITSNNVFLNATALPFLNTSASMRIPNFIEFYGNILADFNDNGTFVDCGAACANISYNNVTKALDFDVTHFTTYSGNGSYPVSTCNTTILTYATLGSDLNGTGMPFCIEFGADNITLDCMGYSIIGDANAFAFTSLVGINASGRTGIKMVNCTVFEYETGIRLANVTNAEINDTYVNCSNVWCGSGNALVMIQSNDIVIRRSTFNQGSNPAADMQFSNNNSFYDSQILSPNDDGLDLQQTSNNNLFERTNFTAADFPIIINTGSASNTFRDVRSTATNNEAVSISSNAGGGNTFVRLTAYAVADDGMDINAVDNVTIVDSTVSGLNYGIDIDGVWPGDLALGHNFTNVNFTSLGTPYDGVRLDSAMYCTFTNVRAQSASLDGILLSRAYNNTFNGLVAVSGSGDPNIPVASLNSSALSPLGLADADGITLDINSAGNNFTDTKIVSAINWIYLPSAGNNSFANTSFVNDFGIIRIDGQFVPPTPAFPGFQLGPQVAISANSAFVNSSNLTVYPGMAAFNQSGRIKLDNLINFSGVLVDYDDDGVFVNCTDCSNVQYNAALQNLYFDVSHFTTYQANAIVAMSCPMTLNVSFNLTNDMPSRGNCITVNGSDLTIDCKGFTITGDGTGFGVRISDLPGPLTNVTIQNCNIDNFEFDVFINASNTGASHTIVNNNLTNATNSAMYSAGGAGPTNLNVANNYIHKQGAVGGGALHSSNSESGNVYTNNRVSALTGTAINIMGSFDPTNFTNTIIESGNVWASLSPTNAMGIFTMVNTTFRNAFGDINVVPRVTAPVSTVDQSNLVIALNRSFINSTNLTWLNTTSNIVLHGLPFATAPAAVFDLADTGVYVACNAPRCTNTAYAAGTFSMQVSRWTSYAAQVAGGQSPTPRIVGGGGSSGLGNAVFVSPDALKQKTQKAQKPKAAAEEKEEEAIMQQVREIPMEVISERSIIPVVTDNATNLMRVVFFTLAFLALIVLGIMIFKRKKFDSEDVSNRLKEIRSKIGKLR